MAASDRDAVVTLATSGGTVATSSSGYRVESLGPARAEWRTQIATSPYVKGAALISAVRDVTELAVGIVCDGDGDHAAAQALVDAIDAAASGEGTVTVELDGSVTLIWDCWPASYEAPLIEWPYWWHGQRLVRLTIPVQPDPEVS